MSTIFWSLLVVFILHNLEECLTMKTHGVGPFQTLELGRFVWAVALLTLLMAVFVAVATFNGPGSIGAIVGVFAIASVGINSLVHIAGSLRYRRYVPGLLTALFLCLPLAGYATVVALHSAYLSQEGIGAVYAVAALSQYPLVRSALWLGGILQRRLR